VDDLVDGLGRLMATPSDVIGPVNLGNPQEFTILELATRVIELVGTRSKVVYGKKPEDDPKQRRPDISLAQSRLGWQPRTPLVEGLKKTVPYFEALLKNNDIKQQLLAGSGGRR
jgi:UDP-glucuronate decarboxylase